MQELESEIGYKFSSKELLTTALTHSSYAYENNLKRDNERLEFLGDAVLEMVISAYLFSRFPGLTEGKLTRLRAAVVCETSLARLARQIKMGEFLLLGRGEDVSGGRNRDSLLADAMEALFGAIYLDAGLSTAESAIIALLKPYVESIHSNDSMGDYKTHLQEILQRDGVAYIKYRIVAESGPSHDKRFTVEVLYEGEVLGVGEGKSKKEAEQMAAKHALESKYAK